MPVRFYAAGLGFAGLASFTNLLSSRGPTKSGRGDPLLSGMLAAPTLLGLLTNIPKTFTAIFLLFLCVAVISKTALDFAGWLRLRHHP